MSSNDGFAYSKKPKVIKLASYDVSEQRTIIKLCVAPKKSPREITELVKQATGKNRVNLTTIYKWHGQFSRGVNSIEDETRAGRLPKINSKIVTSLSFLP